MNSKKNILEIWISFFSSFFRRKERENWLAMLNLIGSSCGSPPEVCRKMVEQERLLRLVGGDGGEEAGEQQQHRTLH